MASQPAVRSPHIAHLGTPTQPYRERRPSPERLAKLGDGAIAIFFAFVAQLLIAGFQCGLGGGRVDFPASILAMAAVFVIFSVSGCILPGVEDFYCKRLKGATDLLNRHMSIGFTIPVIMICRGPISDARTIAMIIVCFALTGIFNTVFAYALTFPLQCLMVRSDKAFWADGAPDSEKGGGQGGSKLRMPIRSICEGSTTDSSLTLGTCTPGGATPEQRLSIVPTENSCSSEPSQPPPRWVHVRDWALDNPMLILCWLLALTVGLPLRYSASQNDVALATLLLFAVWLTTLTIQSAVKSAPALAPWQRTLLAGLLNPVLWTSLAMTAYALLDSTLSHRPLPAMLDTLQTHTTLSTLLLRASGATIPPPAHNNNNNPPGPTDPPHPPSWMAAGDIAISILNAGLVAWGCKLYECRAQLLSRAGLGVCAAAGVLALANVCGGPLLARALGVAPPARALAFAARSVTIALADPVMGALGGDAGLNAAMVVVSGIVYQMGLGLGVGGWLERRVVGRLMRVIEAATVQQRANDPRTVAAGVTVGINAAAMGTAYLYETQSEAAPHAALSMMALGVMTVVFSSISPLARWVIDGVSA
ncbi:hypothetical protein BT67DRAFT_377824 [Trichocladium antarcticum]|uniref:LrgB-like protein n=1 Tax=Trichocladium antarcticum TaxID=1450529 RepID=A0AAN6UM40_9PEZI|nr:hypothetical protein BT67DRAFT_377824 [Trichocladium antarcticum]